MSKKGTTTNLGLMTYINAVGIPTFLNEWTDNAQKIDTFAGTINDAISALDNRLSSAENTLSDLSPESIEDYKIRLNALEKKVVINTTAIKDFNTRVNTIDAQIRSINTEQAVQNARLDAIETVNSNQTTLINGLTADLQNANNTIANHESRISALENEVSDLQSDVNGFNDDITALATQVETLSNAVSELTTLVNSLQLDVILERITAIETDISSLESEIGNTDYSSIANDISSALVELANRISALTPQAYDELLARLGQCETDISALQNAVNGLGDLASKDSASGTYTPQGSVSVSMSGGSAGVAPSLVYDSVNESLSFDAGSVTVVGTPSASFSGTEDTITVS